MVPIFGATLCVGILYTDTGTIGPAVVHRYSRLLLLRPRKGCGLWWVCLSVSLSARISPEPHARSLPIFLCTLPMDVDRSSSGRMTKSQGEGAILGVVRPIQKHWQSSLQPSLPRSLLKGSLLWWVRLSVCVSVCLRACVSVCLSVRLCVRQDISEPHARSLPFFAHVSYVRGSVLLRHVYDRLHRLSRGRDFLPHWQYTITRSLQKGSFDRQ